MITVTYDTTAEPDGRVFDVPNDDALYIDANDSTNGIQYVQNVGAVPLNVATSVANSGGTSATYFNGITIEPNTVMKLTGAYDLFVCQKDGHDGPITGKVMVMGGQFK